MTEELAFQYKSLLLAVEAMREQQKLFFSTKSPNALRNSKELEKNVDKLIAGTRALLEKSP